MYNIYSLYRAPFVFALWSLYGYESVDLPQNFLYLTSSHQKFSAEKKNSHKGYWHFESKEKNRQNNTLRIHGAQWIGWEKNSNIYNIITINQQPQQTVQT